MKKLFLSLLCLGILSSAYAKKPEMVTVNRCPGVVVSALNVSGSFDINIRQGDTPSVTITLPSKYEDQLICTVDGDGVLLLSWASDIERRANERATVNIVSPNLNQITGFGEQDITLQGNITLPSLDLNVAGGSLTSDRLTVTERMSIVVHGGAQVELTGYAEQCTVKNTNDCIVDLSKFNIKNLEN